MSDLPVETWEPVWEQFETLRSSVAKSKALNVNTERLRTLAKECVQTYFRKARPNLIALRLTADDLADLDGYMQDLLRLANGRNSKRSYLAAMASIRRIKPHLDARREMLLGQRSQAYDSSVLQATSVDSRIVGTLAKLLPAAAASYQQAIDDLRAKRRSSYRGTAVEIRETIREVLDHLAPDDAMTKAPGFTFEKDRTQPTMRQKVRFILTSRAAPNTSLASAQHALTLIEETTASLTRTVYERGSIATHIATRAQDVQKLKLYSDAILAELLEIF